MKRISVLAIAGIFVFCSESHSFAGNGIDECGFGKKSAVVVQSSL